MHALKGCILAVCGTFDGADKSTAYGTWRLVWADNDAVRASGGWIKEGISKYEFVENEDWKLTFAKTGERKNITLNDFN